MSQLQTWFGPVAVKLVGSGTLREFNWVPGLRVEDWVSEHHP